MSENRQPRSPEDMMLELKELIIMRMSGYDSQLLKEIKIVGDRVAALEIAMGNYKFGWTVFKWIGGGMLLLLGVIWQIVSHKVGL